MIRTALAALLVAVLSLASAQAGSSKQSFERYQKLAQLNGGFMFPGPGTVHSTGGGFSGPCDASSGCKAFYGFVSGTAAYASAHSPAADICDQATCTTLATINFLSTGYWDAATAAASSACSVACVVKRFYDSSGNGTAAATGVGSTTYGLIVFNSLGSCSAVINSATYANSPNYLTGTITTINQPWTMVSLAKNTYSFVNNAVLADLGGTTYMGFYSGFNQIQMLSTNTANDTTHSTDGTYHAIIGVGNGASGSLNVDGNATSLNTSTNALSSLSMGADSFGTHQPSAFTIFGGYWSSAVTVATLNSNIHGLCGGF